VALATLKEKKSSTINIVLYVADPIMYYLTTSNHFVGLKRDNIKKMINYLV